MKVFSLNSAYNRGDEEIISYIYSTETNQTNKDRIFSAVANKMLNEKNYDLIKKFIVDNENRFSNSVVENIMQLVIEASSTDCIIFMSARYPTFDFTSCVISIINKGLQHTQLVKKIFDILPKTNYNAQKIMTFLIQKYEYNHYFDDFDFDFDSDSDSDFDSDSDSDSDNLKFLNYILDKCPGILDVSDPKIIAIASEKYLTVLEKHGCNINAKSPDGKTALSYSCKSGSLNIIKMLLSHGAVVTPDVIVSAQKAKYFDIIELVNSKFNVELYNSEYPSYKDAMNIHTKWKKYQEHLEFHCKLNFSNLIKTAMRSPNSSINWLEIFPDIDRKKEEEKNNIELIDRVLYNLGKSYPLNLVPENIKEELEKKI